MQIGLIMVEHVNIIKVEAYNSVQIVFFNSGMGIANHSLAHFFALVNVKRHDFRRSSFSTRYSLRFGGGAAQYAS